MEFEALTGGTIFIEDGKKYVVIQNISKWLRFQSPIKDFVLVYRPCDNGLTFRAGMLSDKIIKTGIVVKDSNLRICPKCKQEKHFMQMQGIQHCQANKEIEVCTDCKTEFIKLNDTFFRELL